MTKRIKDVSIFQGIYEFEMDGVWWQVHQDYNSVYKKIGNAWHHEFKMRSTGTFQAVCKRLADLLADDDDYT